MGGPPKPVRTPAALLVLPARLPPSTGAESCAPLSPTQINPARLLSSGQIERLASKNGGHRTVYFTKELPPEGNSYEKKYARTQQYLGEWKDNKYEGKGTLEKADGTRYVGEWQDGKRDGVGTLWHRHKDGSLRKVYSGHWVNDTMTGRGARPVAPSGRCARRAASVGLCSDLGHRRAALSPRCPHRSLQAR